MNALAANAMEALGMLDVPLKSFKADARDEVVSKLQHFIFFSQKEAVKMEAIITQRDKAVHDLTLELQKIKVESFTAAEEDDDDVDTITDAMRSKLHVNARAARTNANDDIDTVKFTVVVEPAVIVEDVDDEDDEDDDAIFNRLINEDKKK